MSMLLRPAFVWDLSELSRIGLVLAELNLPKPFIDREYYKVIIGRLERMALGGENEMQEQSLLQSSEDSDTDSNNVPSPLELTEGDQEMMEGILISQRNRDLLSSTLDRIRGCFAIYYLTSKPVEIDVMKVERLIRRVEVRFGLSEILSNQKNSSIQQTSNRMLWKSLVNLHKSSDKQQSTDSESADTNHVKSDPDYSESLPIPSYLHQLHSDFIQFFQRQFVNTTNVKLNKGIKFQQTLDSSCSSFAPQQTSQIGITSPLYTVSVLELADNLQKIPLHSEVSDTDFKLSNTNSNDSIWDDGESMLSALEEKFGSVAAAALKSKNNEIKQTDSESSESETVPHSSTHIALSFLSTENDFYHSSSSPPPDSFLADLRLDKLYSKSNLNPNNIKFKTNRNIPTARKLAEFNLLKAYNWHTLVINEEDWESIIGDFEVLDKKSDLNDLDADSILFEYIKEREQVDWINRRNLFRQLAEMN